MSTHTLFVIASILGIVTSVYAAMLTFFKIRAQRHLIDRLIEDRHLDPLIEHYRCLEHEQQDQDKEFFELRKKIIREMAEAIKDLDFVERKSIETGLFQPSRRGRDEYFEEIVDEVEARKKLVLNHAA